MWRDLVLPDWEKAPAEALRPGDPRLRGVAWRDLVKLSRGETVYEILIYAPWLAASLVFADRGWLWAAVPCSFMGFLTCLRLSHNAQHNLVGIGRRGDDAILLWLSLVMLWPNHAVKFNHLQHHKYMLREQDIEGASARMSGLGALALGALFQPMLALNALRHGRRSMKLFVAAELSLNVVWIALVLFVFDWPALQYHVATMAVGHLFTAFFCVWSVHHHSAGHLYPARTQRGRLANMLSYNMFLHVEHHLFPAVPTCHLHRLAERLDVALPGLAARQALPLAA